MRNPTYIVSFPDQNGTCYHDYGFAEGLTVETMFKEASKLLDITLPHMVSEYYKVQTIDRWNEELNMYEPFAYRLVYGKTKTKWRLWPCKAHPETKRKVDKPSECIWTDHRQRLGIENERTNRS